MRATQKGALLWVLRRELPPKLAQVQKGDNCNPRNTVKVTVECDERIGRSGDRVIG